MRRSRTVRLARLATAAAAAAVVALASGCGSSDEPRLPASGLPAAGGGGTLAYAVPARPSGRDPLAATGATAELISRQLHEPLVFRAAGPYGSGDSQRGLVRQSRSAEDDTVWTLDLRTGVLFGDGTPFDSDAVVANGRRWLTTEAGRELLPELVSVESVDVDQVRFTLSAPVDLPERLSSPRLGIVSPQALEPRNGEAAEFVNSASGSGTGPFQLGERGPKAMELTRNAGWWGTPLGLGPALDSVAFARVPAGGERFRLLDVGEVQVAYPLDAAQLGLLSANPLLTSLETPRGTLGLEASVRGLEAEVQSLSSVWLTTVEG